MIIYILLLILSIAVLIKKKRDISIVSKITTIILLCLSWFFIISVYLIALENDTGFYKNLFHFICNTQILFFFVILFTILRLAIYFIKNIIIEHYIIYIILFMFNIFSKKNNPPKPYTFIKLNLQNNVKGFFSLMIDGIFISIPNCYLSIIKNYGINFLLGLPLFVNVIAYINTDTISTENLQEQLQVIITELNRTLPQLSNFINQFHNYISENGINVITNAQGSLDIDISNNISNSLAQQYANRINVFDNLIRHHIDSIEDLLERGLQIEQQLRELNNNYVSQLIEDKNKLNTLINSYKHYKKD